MEPPTGNGRAAPAQIVSKLVKTGQTLCLCLPDGFGAIDEFYRLFDQVGDEEKRMIPKDAKSSGVLPRSTTYLER